MSIQHTIFISPNRLKRDTPLSQSVDDNLISPMILTAQDKHIWTALGTDLYDALRQDINVGAPIMGNYKILLEKYIQPALVWFSFAEILPVLRVRFVNNAVTVMNSEQSTGASYEDIKPVINKSLDTAQFYRQRLIDYLCNNSTLFPQYTTNTGEDLDPETRNYYSGLNVDTSVYESNLQLKAVISAIGIKGTDIC